MIHCNPTRERKRRLDRELYRVRDHVELFHPSHQTLPRAGDTLRENGTSVPVVGPPRVRLPLAKIASALKARHKSKQLSSTPSAGERENVRPSSSRPSGARAGLVPTATGCLRAATKQQKRLCGETVRSSLPSDACPRPCPYTIQFTTSAENRVRAWVTGTRTTQNSGTAPPSTRLSTRIAEGFGER